MVWAQLWSWEKPELRQAPQGGTPTLPPPVCLPLPELLLPTPAEEDAWKPLSSQPFGETTVALQNSSSRVAALVCARKALPGGSPTKVKTDVQKLPSQQEGARILLSDAPAAPLGASVSPPLWKWLLGPPLTLLENREAAFRSQPFGLVPRAQLPQTSPGSLAKDSSPQRQSPSGQESPKCVTTGDRCGAEMNDISGLLSHWSASRSTCCAVVEFPGAVAAGRRVAASSKASRGTMQKHPASSWTPSGPVQAALAGVRSEDRGDC